MASLGALLILSLLASLDAFKVLIYSPKFGPSHVQIMGRIADILVNEGMDVTVLLPKLNPKITKNGTSLAKTITVETDARVLEFFKDDSHIATAWTQKFQNPLADKAFMDKVKDVHAYQCEHTLRQKDILDALRNDKFDLGLSEVFDLCAMGLFEEIGLEKHILVNTALLFEKVADIFGAPNLPGVVPGLFGSTSNQMTYFQRLVNMLKMEMSKRWTDSMKDAEEEVVERVLGKKVDFEEKMGQAAFVITNTDPLLDFPRPITERLVNIGGITVPTPKPLDDYWEKVVTQRKATILFSFGSVAQSYTMPSEMKKAVLETFQRFPEVTFIWKYEIDEDEVAKDVPNVVTNKWVPQNDLLAHPNLKLFVTHCGMNSILETSTRGVPLLSIPLFGDQTRNAEMVKRFGTAKVVDKGALTDADAFEAHIREALENPSYRKNASRLSQMMAKRPRNQREELVKHIKFAAEFGSLPEYRIPQLSFLQYYMLDIIVPFSLVLMVIGALVLYGCAKLLQRLFIAKVEHREDRSVLLRENYWKKAIVLSDGDELAHWCL
ncbi:hypothetical protein QR680_009791 [Steinernema hermaphroditum]|uniref:glucuronosyltransferase n=1 Tax=Steinernema hermaphroditum TaxID=289476 RepID=A0AA39IP37_9BILA|nr:hypothetical protein QR680_009791 [Steinernema hermaphroditum]